MAMTVEPLGKISDATTDLVVGNIQKQQQTIQDKADSLFVQGGGLVLSAQEAINGIVDSLVDPGIGQLPEAPALTDLPTPPIILITTKDIADPEITGPESFSGAGGYTPKDIAFPAKPVFFPSLNLPAIPNVAQPTAPVSPAAPAAVTIPNAPTLIIPTAPLIAGITLPVVPTVVLPVFDNSTLPTWTEVPPSLPDIAAGVPVNIQSTLLDAFGTLTQNMDPHTISTVYNQEITRVADGINKQAGFDVAAAWDELASRGFVAPIGAVARRIDAIRADASAKVRTANRDLALGRLQAELDVYKQNIQTGAELAKTQIDRDLQATRLKLDILIAASRNMIDLYNALVEVFKAKNLAAQVAADVYKARLQGELSKVDLYAKQIDAQRAIVDVSVAQMQGYEAQVRGVLAQAELYRAQIEGVKAQLDAQAQVLNVFKEQVDAYVAQVNGVKATYDAYDSQVRGALAPVQLYEALMRGYAAEVDGAKAAVEAEQIRANVAMKQDDIAIQAFAANIDAVVKGGQLKIETVRANTAIEQTRLSAVETQARSDIALYQGNIEAYRAQSTLGVSRYEAAIKAFEVQASQNTQRIALHVEAAKGTAQVSAQLAASALAGLHVQESLSASTGLSMNSGNQGQWSYGYNESHAFQGE